MASEIDLVVKDRIKVASWTIDTVSVKIKARNDHTDCSLEVVRVNQVVVAIVLIKAITVVYVLFLSVLIVALQRKSKKLI